MASRFANTSNNNAKNNSTVWKSIRAKKKKHSRQNKRYTPEESPVKNNKKINYKMNTDEVKDTVKEMVKEIEKKNVVNKKDVEKINMEETQSPKDTNQVKDISKLALKPKDTNTTNDTNKHKDTSNSKNTNTHTTNNTKTDRLSHKPICFNYEKPCVDCIKPIQFLGIKKTYVIGEDIQLDYTIHESFHPKSGDWVGLFRLCKDIDKCFEFAGFKWAQKNASFKEKPRNRSVVFYPNDVEVKASDDSYVFLYLSTNERILGQSDPFNFKLYSTKVNEQALATKMVSYAVKTAIKEMKKSKSRLKDEEEEKDDDDTKKNLLSHRDNALNIDNLNKMKQQQKLQEKKWQQVTANSQDVAPKTTPQLDIQDNHVPKMIKIFEELIEREMEMTQRMEKMEKNNLAIFLSQQLVQQQANENMISKNLRMSLSKKIRSRLLQEQLNCLDCQTQDLLTENSGRCLYGPKNVDYYQKNGTKDLICSEMNNALDLEEKRRFLKQKLYENAQRKLEEEKHIKIKKAATQIADLIREIDNDDLLKAKSVQNQAVQKLSMSMEEVKKKLKKGENIQKQRKDKSLTSVYSGSFVGLNRLFDPKQNMSKKKLNSKTQKRPEKTLNPLLKDVHRADYSIRLVYKNKDELSSSVPDQTLKKLFEDICSNEALLVDVAKDRSILIQPIDRDLVPLLAANPEFNAANKLEAINRPASFISKSNESNVSDSKPALYTTTSNVLEELKELSRHEKIFGSSSYPCRNPNSTKSKLEKIKNLLNSCFSNEIANTVPSISTHSSFSGNSKLSDLSMRVHRGSTEQTHSPLVQSPAVTKLALLDSLDILSPTYRETVSQNNRLKRDHTAKLLLITNILDSNMTDENKILTLKQIIEACPILSQLEKNTRKHFNSPNTKARTRFSEFLQTEYENSDSDYMGADEEDFFKAFNLKVPFFRPAYKKPALKVKKTIKKRKKQKKPKKPTDDKFFETETLIKKISKEEDEEKQISNFPRLVRKPLPSILPMVLNTESRTSMEDESKMKPILKKSSPHAIKPCKLSRKASLNFLNEIHNMAAKDINKQEKQKQQEAEESGNFKRERKVSFNTIILTSLFDNEDIDKDDVGRNKVSISSNGNDKWPGNSEEKTEKVSTMQQFLNLLEREVRVVTDNAYEIQNSISKAVKLFRDEAINMKNKCTDSFGKAFRSLSPQRSDKKERSIDNKKEEKVRVNVTKIPKAMSIDHMNGTQNLPKSLPNYFGSLTNNFEKKSKTEKHTEDVNDPDLYPQSPVTRKTKIKGPLAKDDVQVYFSKELEIQTLLGNVMKQITENKIEKIKRESQKQNEKKENQPKTPTKTNEPPVSKFSDFWDENGTILANISDNSLQVLKGKVNTTPVQSLNSETSLNSMVPNAQARSFYSNGTQFSRLSEYDTQSINMTSPTNPSLNLIQSFDSTITSIVKLYNNLTNILCNQTEKSSNLTKSYEPMVNKTRKDENVEEIHKTAARLLQKPVSKTLSDEYNELILDLTTKKDPQQDISNYNEMLENIKKHDTSDLSTKKSTYASKTAKNVTKKGEVIEIEDTADGKEFCLTCSDEFPRLKTTVEKFIANLKENKADFAERGEDMKKKKKKKKFKETFV